MTEETDGTQTNEGSKPSIPMQHQHLKVSGVNNVDAPILIDEDLKLSLKEQSFHGISVEKSVNISEPPSPGTLCKRTEENESPSPDSYRAFGAIRIEGKGFELTPIETPEFSMQKSHNSKSAVKQLVPRFSAKQNLQPTAATVSANQ